MADNLLITERHGRSLTSYHLFQGDTDDCGPHVVTMAVNFWHGEDRLNVADVVRAMNRPRVGVGFPPLVIRRIPNWATFPWGIADMLRQHSIPARWRLFATEDHLRRALREDRLLMPIYGEPLRRQEGHWRGWSHVALLIGWNAASEDYVFVDSTRHSAPVTMQRAEFMRKWRNMGRLLIETR
jgi:hypothetical protein